VLAALFPSDHHVSMLSVVTTGLPPTHRSFPPCKAFSFYSRGGGTGMGWRLDGWMRMHHIILKLKSYIFFQRVFYSWNVTVFVLSNNMHELIYLTRSSSKIYCALLHAKGVSWLQNTHNVNEKFFFLCLVHRIIIFGMFSSIYLKTFCLHYVHLAISTLHYE
jgi:hypothetical protein